MNIRHGRGLDGKVNLKRIAELLKNSKATIIGLNEVDKYFSRRSNFVDQANWLASELNMFYVYGPAISLKWATTREYGNALLSIYPIVQHTNNIFRLTTKIAEPRSVLEATVNVNERKLKVLVGHFSFHPTLHNRQIEFCLGTDESYPLIIMGDLNRKPNSSSYKKMVKKYHDCSFNNNDFTFPSKKPKSKIDYIFVNKYFTVDCANVIKSDASDHLPVFSKLKLLS
ncbi:hypothetical protein BKP45_00205 [Anaerobacillus alkalidiazotrophicus]|uniref:Endonuclease/exonuclease/phosphatase domain-containing protein n=1 Tax=Anaerobacillus alkalidiazotrophicus TaxID=472963 RepID=A0A1S2MCZ5_9BACI|nr:endonuclease/exonuclease/phosphatase family protein [Anaerobacillus alkalidiazotrophicus]OIJ22434.1 hypothetical protein BKP45_00205 [Anaerobacillus alkalidiazotrophicus]